MTPVRYAPRYKNSWAIVVGINNYQHIAPLGYACNDADVMAEILQNELGFAASNIVLLKDELASKREILEIYLGLHERANDPDDRVLVFFAGHGYTHIGKRGEVGYLVPVDGFPDNLASLIRWDELTRNGDLIPAKHLLFIMDACYGGLAITRSPGPGSMRFLKNMLQRFARQVITAGKADEVVGDAGGPIPKHSVFTGHLLQALEGNAATTDGG